MNIRNKLHKFQRICNIPKNNSFFLFGPRGTGKSTLVSDTIPEADSLYIDLLLYQNEERYSQDPDFLYRQVKALPKSITKIVIDEIQKIPKLLDIVHKLIEETDKQFILTGSSARKLKKGSANLLAGRAFERSLFPLVYLEIQDQFQIDDILKWGSLPHVFSLPDDDSKADYLKVYANTYLKEEIWSEHLIRKLEPFRRFLEIAAQHNGSIINFHNIAKDVGVDSKTVKTYFEILEDTLVGFILEPYMKSKRKRVYKSPKFYFFDIGVCRALANLLRVPPMPSTSYYGDLFEHFVILECIRLSSYFRNDFRFFYMADPIGEIDLIVERPGQKLAVIEIKSSHKVQTEKILFLAKAKSFFSDAEYYCLSQDPTAQIFEDIHILHWKEGLEKVFGEK